MATRVLAPRTAVAALLIAVPLALAGCSDSSTTTKTGAGSPSASSGAPSSTGASSDGAACAPVAGDQLVALKDDKQLQHSDNIIPVVRTAKVTPALTAALDKVSAALSQDALAGLNKATDVERQQPAQAAADFVKAKDLGAGLSGGSGPIKVVAANFAENQTLANVYAQALKAAGFSSSVVQLTNREVYEAALEKGDADVVPEYAATLTDFLDKKAGGSGTRSSGDVTATVTALKALAAPRGLTPLTPAAATDQNTFAVTKGFATKYKVASLSELATACGGGVSLGGPPECPQRPFCQLGLQDTYKLKVSDFASLDAGGSLSKNALKTGKVALALVFSSDASLAAS